jgi:hypothetical protein
VVDPHRKGALRPSRMVVGATPSFEVEGPFRLRSLKKELLIGGFRLSSSHRFVGGDEGPGLPIWLVPAGARLYRRRCSQVDFVTIINIRSDQSQCSSSPGSPHHACAARPQDESWQARSAAAYTFHRRTGQAVMARSLAHQLPAEQGRTQAMALLGNPNDDPEPAKTQVLPGPPGSKLGTTGANQPHVRPPASWLFSRLARAPHARPYEVRLRDSQKDRLDWTSSDPRAPPRNMCCRLSAGHTKRTITRRRNATYRLIIGPHRLCRQQCQQQSSNRTVERWYQLDWQHPSSWAIEQDRACFRRESGLWSLYGLRRKQR